MVDSTGYTPLVIGQDVEMRAWGGGSVAKCLPYKHESLSSVRPSTGMSTSNSSSADTGGALGFAAAEST